MHCIQVSWGEYLSVVPMVPSPKYQVTDLAPAAYDVEYYLTRDLRSGVLYCAGTPDGVGMYTLQVTWEERDQSHDRYDTCLVM